MLKFPKKEERKNERKEGQKKGRKGRRKEEREKGNGIIWGGLLGKEKTVCKR